MPNIVEYEARGEITPSDKGIQGAVEAARVYARLGQEAGSSLHAIGDQIENHMAIMETSELYKTGTELKQNLQTRYEKESALPENRGNPHFGAQFMAEVTPQIDAWGKGASTDHGKQLAATLGGSIRNEIFNHVAAGQSEMDAAHVDDNHTQTRNLLGAGLITDPSEANLVRTLGTMKDANQAITATIPDVGMRERAFTEYNARDMSALVATRYQGVAESIKNQIATTGGETSPALDQLNKDIKSQLGFQYIAPEIQTQLSKLGDTAVKQGQEMYRSKQATIKSDAIEQGKTAFSAIHNVLTELAMDGKPPTPDMVNAIHNYAMKFGASNPGEAASLDDYLLRTRTMAQGNTVQPYNPQVRNSIQVGMSLPKDDPGRPTEASLLKAYSSGQITSDDLSMYTTMVDKINKPEKDPAFGPAHESFVRWQNQMAQSIGNNGLPGTAVARAQFFHDSTANFMARGRNGGDWDKALTMVTDVNNIHNFNQMLPMYQKAAMKPDAAAYFRNNGVRFTDDGAATPAHGSVANPVVPTKGTPAQPVKLDQKAVDDAIWSR